MAVAHATAPKPGTALARLSVLGVLGIGVVAVLLERLYRETEVRFAGVLLRMFTSEGVHVAGERETVYFGLSGDDPLGLRMTPECSSVFMLLPLLVVSAVLLWMKPANAPRVLTSLLCACAAVVAVNQLRILTIVGLVDWLGADEGYYWGHTLFGSLVSVLGGAVALVLFVWLSTRKSRAERGKTGAT